LVLGLKFFFFTFGACNSFEDFIVEHSANHGPDELRKNWDPDIGPEFVEHCGWADQPGWVTGTAGDAVETNFGD
jgi:hypothetical protein